MCNISDATQHLSLTEMGMTPRTPSMCEQSKFGSGLGLESWLKRRKIWPKQNPESREAKFRWSAPESTSRTRRRDEADLPSERGRKIEADRHEGQKP